MDRRTLLKTGGMAVLGFGFGGCATARSARTAPARTAPARPALNLPRVEISWDRVIRTTVGLRPHRPAGFNLKAEKLDAKTLIHNYGHGGAGHSLGWGTGLMAAELALEHADRRAAVIGCGTVGLTAARQLQRRGFDVTIYAMSVPPDTTSNMALAGFTPTSGLISAERSSEWDAQFRRAVEIAYRQLQLLAGPNYGVSWVDNYTPSDDPTQPTGGGNQPGAGMTDANSLLPVGMRTTRELLQPGEHPFPTRYAFRSTGIRIEPSIYLDALLRDVILYGGHLVIRKFDTARDLMSLDESLIVNCSGLGSRTLFSDETMMPVKGQLTVLVPQPEINYRASGNGASMMPRRDGIALGSTQERNVWTLEPNDEARKRIVEGHMQFFAAMRPPNGNLRLTQSFAPREIPTVESFFGEES